LEPEDFIKECDRRGIKLTMSLLEDLHRHKVLVPFYRVREGAPSPKDVVDVSQSSIPDLGTSGLLSRLIVPASEGRVTDPSSERFLRWRRRRPNDLEPLSRQTGYWYSYHQILTVVRAKALIDDRETVFRTTRDPKRPATSQRLNHDALPTEHEQRSAATLRSLAVLLSALDTRYWPEIFRRVYWYDEWVKLESDFSPQAMLSWLGSDPSELAKRAERLRVDGGFADPTGDFYDLIRRARPEMWDSLSGDALIAMDVRIAAEVIELFLGQLNGVETAPSPQAHLKHQRLSARDKSLDESLTITGLSPHPSLVVAVEGATEYFVIPKVFAALDVAPTRAGYESRISTGWTETWSYLPSTPGASP